MHVRPAPEGGFPLDEIKEMLLQQAIYCGVPAANTAFRDLGEVIEELRGKGVKVNGAHAAEPDFAPSVDLLAAAKKEGKIVLYTANFLDTEQAVAKRFSERFPGMQIEIVRAPTGQLITRIKTEAAGNKLIADVIDISDRVQARVMIGFPRMRIPEGVRGADHCVIIHP